MPAFPDVDRELQTDVSTSLAGERGPVVLPILLTQSASNRAEERALQRAAGISGFGDMAAIMQSAPRDLVGTQHHDARV